jgi:hypothetical protein
MEIQKEEEYEIQREYFECDCYSDEHTVKWTFIDEEIGPELYFSVFLNDYADATILRYMEWLPTPIFLLIHHFIAIPIARIYRSIKYIFGYRSKYGCFDSFNLRYEDADRMIGLIQKFKLARERTMKERTNEYEKQKIQ